MSQHLQANHEILASVSVHSLSFHNYTVTSPHLHCDLATVCCLAAVQLVEVCICNPGLCAPVPELIDNEHRTVGFVFSLAVIVTTHQVSAFCLPDNDSKAASSIKR